MSLNMNFEKEFEEIKSLRIKSLQISDEANTKLDLLQKKVTKYIFDNKLFQDTILTIDSYYELKNCEKIKKLIENLGLIFITNDIRMGLNGKKVCLYFVNSRLSNVAEFCQKNGIKLESNPKFKKDIEDKILTKIKELKNHTELLNILVKNES